METTKKPLLDLEYYDPTSLEKQSFLMIPAIMLPQPSYEDDEDYNPYWDNTISKLSSDAKILYVLMRNRMMASYHGSNLKRFTDNDGHVFIIMRNEEIQARLHVSKPTAVKLIELLEETGLIRVARTKNATTKKNSANRYYVMDVNSILANDFEGREITKSRVKKLNPENQVKKLNPESQVKKLNLENQVKILNHSLESNSIGEEVNNINPSKITRYTEENRKEKAKSYLRKRVEFERYLDWIYGFQTQDVASMVQSIADSLLDEMGEILVSSKKYYKISGNRIEANELIDIVKKADYEWFSCIVSKLTQTPSNVKNGRAYARSIIYHTKEESLDDLSGSASIIRHQLYNIGDS